MSTATMDDVSRETFEGEDPFPGMPTPGQKVDDPEAPYGYTSDGKPRAKPGRKPGQKVTAGKTIHKTIPAPPRKATSRPIAAPKKTQTDYRPALMSLAGEAVGTASVWGLMKDDVKIIANTAAVWRATPSIVEGINTAADRWPLVATVLDRFLPLAEFGKSGGAFVLMVAQIAVNQRFIPPGLFPGTMAPETMASAFIEEMVKTNPDFAAAVAAIQQARMEAQSA